MQKTMELVNQNDGFLPCAFEVEAMQKDVQLLNALYPMLQAALQLQDLIVAVNLDSCHEPKFLIVFSL